MGLLDRGACHSKAQISIRIGFRIGDSSGHCHRCLYVPMQIIPSNWSVNLPLGRMCRTCSTSIRPVETTSGSAMCLQSARVLIRPARRNVQRYASGSVVNARTGASFYALRRSESGSEAAHLLQRGVQLERPVQVMGGGHAKSSPHLTRRGTYSPQCTSAPPQTGRVMCCTTGGHRSKGECAVVATMPLQGVLLLFPDAKRERAEDSGAASC